MEEAAVALGVRHEELPARRVVHERTGDWREQTNEFVAPRIQLLGKRAPIQEPIQRLLFPDAISHPIAGGWKDRQQPTVLSAAKGNSSVGNREDVLPERVRRPKHLHHRKVPIQSGARVLSGGSGRNGFRIARERRLRASPLCMKQRSDAHKGSESEQTGQMFHRERGDYRSELAIEEGRLTN